MNRESEGWEERKAAGVEEEDINNTIQPSNRRERETERQRDLKGDDREIGGE